MYFYGLWALLLLLSYPVQVARLTYAGNKGSRVNFIRALFLVLGKFPEISGILKFFINRIMNTKARLIEYK